MKYISIFVALIALVVSGCGSQSRHEHEDNHVHHNHNHEGHNHDYHHKVEQSTTIEHKEEESHHEGEIVIHNHQAEELGIKVTEVAPKDFAVTIAASGEVVFNPSNQSVISAPMSGKVTYSKGISSGVKVVKGTRIGKITTEGMAGGDQLRAAQIEYDAAKKEVERLSPLREEGIITVGEYNAALANLERAKNSLSEGAGSVITAPMTGVITTLSVGEGGYANSGDIIGQVVGDGGMSLRVDVASREVAKLGKISTINVKFPQIEDMVEATALSGGVTSSASAPGYVSMFFQLPAMENVVAGSYAEVYLPTTTVKEVIAVPKSAISDRMGQKMVYVKEPNSDHYRRVPVEVGATDGELVEIIGIESGDSVVTEGVTFVRLAENAGVAVPGHTHNH
ncbi:MAG: efflux RND transporter periplasmic adaptor subunit [Muribaculaceae bacterium]|nr:efflux RND transporter periplasmic adaptor subunit [Muribaculaceae bacterium]